MKRYIFTLLIICLSAIAMAENIITISSVSGISQTEVEVVVSLENTDAISALEMTIPLGDHLQYVDESAALSAIRSNGHQISAAQVAQDLRIYIYSMNLNSIKGNSGELLRFTLLLGDEPGNYPLTPNVVLSSAQGTTLDAHIQSGNVVILAPKLQILNEQIDFGHIPIRSIHTQTLELWNSGSMPLVISDIVVDDSLIIPQQTTLIIEPYSTAYVPLEYAPVNRGAISRSLTVISNDPNGKQQVTIIADPFSVNELHVGSASGIADSIVTIPLTMNNMEPIVAMQCEFVLPRELEYVANTLQVNPLRSNGHMVVSTVKPYIEKAEHDWYEEPQGDTLVLVVFSMSNKSFVGNDGELASFDLRLNGSSGTYNLTPINVILINNSQENMVSATFGGSIDIQSPNFSGEDHINFSNRAITETIKVEYRINNFGSAPLQIERATFLDEGYSIEESLPLTINPWEEKFITVVYQPSEEGDFSTIMNIYTNDPNNRLKAVSLYGHIYEPNALSIDGEIDNDRFTLSVSLNNYTNVVALQYDIHTWEGMTTSQSAFIPTDRMQGHGYVVSNLGNNTYRVIIYSMSNQPLAGNEGLLHQLIFNSQENSFCDNTITLDNIILSNADGKDKVSQPSVSYYIGETKYTEEHITTCDQYTWNDDVYTESGRYTQNLRSVTGCDSIVILNLTINRSEREEYWETACDEYWWHDNQYTESGDYEYYTTTDQGCTRVEVLHLTINRGEREEYWERACDEYWWERNGETYYDSGDYEHYTTTEHGCERVEVLHLTINRSEREEYYATACNEYWWDRNGETYYESGDYEHYTTTDQGCERVEVLHLTINRSEREEYYATACNEYWWDHNGETYYESGDYEHYTTTDQGCERVEVLHLTINTTQYAEKTITACDSYTWNGDTYIVSGEYTYTTTAANGCDSIVTLHLTINHTQYAEETVTACDSYTWNGETYTTSGDYVYTTVASNGCDSIVTLHLTINQSEVGDTEYATICYGETYTWNGQTYAATGEYRVTLTNAAGCDSIATLHLTIMPEAFTTTESVVIGSDELPYTWRGNTYLATGRYIDVEQYTQVDCDSAIHVLDLIVLTTGNFNEESITICETETPYIWYGESYAATGKYTYTEKYAGTDIDSVQHILNLTVNPTKYTEETIITCDAYTWNGETYTASGEYVYTTTAANGCDSVVTLHLTINYTQYAEETVAACDNYTWNGETYTQSGEYLYTTVAANGCDSIVTLHLTINETQYAGETVVACDSYTWNGETYTQSGEYLYITVAANGCDSVVTLHLTINQTQYAEETVVACDSYTWNGETYTQSGEYTYTTTAANGCDSIVTLHLTINETQYAEETVTACDSYTWNGETYTQSGEYVYTTTATNSCDSIVTLHLTVNQTQYAEETVVACDSYTWNGKTYSKSGDYTYTTSAANGCDSIVTLHLTVNQTQYAEESVTACDTYTWNGETYSKSGNYTYTTTAANGCDSIVTLHLTINQTQYAEEVVTACDSYTWNGETYTQSGEYVYTTTATNSCDSIVTLHLTVNQTQYAEEVVTACDSYTWNGKTYTQSGEYVYTTLAANGCDSVVTLHLTINYTQYAEETVAACDSYTWNGETYTESGEYTYTTTASNGCDSIVTLHLTINKSEREEYTAVACDEYYWDHNGETYYESGDYEYYTTTDQGCERVEVLHLTILPEATIESEELALCPSELPYEWYGQSLTEEGTYSATEQYAGMECDSIIHELTLNVYVQTLPATVTLPIVRTGEAIDVTTPTAEIQAHIAAETWYAPNAEVAWYIMDNSDWAALSADPVAAGIVEVTLKYAVETDCGNIESDKMVINLKATDMENTHIQSPTSNCQKILYEDHIYILREGKVYSVMGHEL